MTEFSVIISNYEQEYQAFLSTCQKLKMEDRLRGGVCGFWSPKQVVDHLTGWLREAMQQFIKIKAGEVVDLEYDDDTFNARAVEDRKHLGWEESLKDLDDAKTKNVDFIHQLSRAELAKSDVYANWLIGMTEDYHFHRDQLQIWVEADYPAHPKII